MKTTLIIVMTLLMGITTSQAQFKIDYNPSIQPTNSIQYFKPVEKDLFVGDCIPFYHEGTYYLYWLLDKGHHGALNGLGGHQWCVSTTKDLKNWKHYPIAIGIDEEWEKSICTGSVAFDGKLFYAFYATRLITKENEIKEQLSYAISKDGLNFEKQLPNPFYTSAPGYSQRHFRDPKIVIDKSRTFHLFVSSESEKYIISDAKGTLVHLTSKDLKNWNIEKDMLSGQHDVPECPDYFQWNGWYYLIYGQGGDTYYVKSKQPYGPWEYPESQALLEQWVNVAKTAEFTKGRRIVAGWIPSKKENKDYGNEQFGGNIILREAYQLPNGDLATKWPNEVIPQGKQIFNGKLTAIENAQIISNKEVLLKGKEGISGAYIKNIPNNCHISLEIDPIGNNNEYGLYLRASDKANDGYKFSMNSNKKTIRLGEDAFIESVDGLNRPLKIDIIMKDDIIDICIDERRCIVNRLPEHNGKYLWFYSKQGTVKYKNIKIVTL